MKNPTRRFAASWLSTALAGTLILAALGACSGEEQPEPDGVGGATKKAKGGSGGAKPKTQAGGENGIAGTSVGGEGDFNGGGAPAQGGVPGGGTSALAEAGGGLSSGGWTAGASATTSNCGNGRVDANESCDGTPNCTAECLCASGYHPVGAQCVVNETCRVGSCVAHATCNDQTGGVVCSCVQPWTGPQCGQCIAGYHLSVGSEPTCVIDETCTETTCSKHGVCSAVGGRTSCACDSAAGYTGSSCQACLEGWKLAYDGSCVHVDYCSGRPCLEGGGCTSNWEAKTCVCRSGYTGEACDTCAVGYFDDAGVGFPKCIPDPCVNVAQGACGWGKCVPNAGGAGHTCACTDPNAKLVNNVCVCKSGYVNGASGCVPACSGLHQVWSPTANACVCTSGYADPDPTDSTLSCTACAAGYVDTNGDGICTSTACGYPLAAFCGGTESCHYACEPYSCAAIYVGYTCVDGATLMECKWGTRAGLMGFYWQTVSGVSCSY